MTDANPIKQAKLSRGVLRALENFLICTNYCHGGPTNNEAYEALYEFIQYTHAKSVRLSEIQLRDILISEGAKAEDAEEIALIYLHCRNILYKKRPWDDRKMYGWLATREAKIAKKKEYNHRLVADTGSRA